MSNPYLTERPASALPVHVLGAEDLSHWRQSRPAALGAWLDTARFTGKPGSVCLLPGEGGAPGAVLVGRGGQDWLWCLGALGNALGAVDLYLAESPAPQQASLAALGFGLGTYRFTRYGKPGDAHPRLVLPEGVNGERLLADLRAVTLTRDLINTPAADMMPEHLAAATAELAARHGAQFSEIVGDALLEQNYPAIHAVGRASAHAPRLIELRWGNEAAPGVTLVGKGVCFDTGGLDIKSASGMRHMKKDMGGAAHALGVASRVMDAGLPVHLRVLIPAVENAIAGNAFRPGDVLATRAGKTVEVDNTDAEGRIVLCDALHEACRAMPQALVDFATLTGAARVAVGTELPAMFCNDEAFASTLLAAGAESADPLWRMPLHAPYRELLESRIADMVNSAGVPYAGAITAALFLQSFVDEQVPWVHFDIMAWNLRTRPGRPEGGEAMGVRAVFSALESRFATS